tara:strand:- start:26442 stop:27104 length:663 start_codon:yes stop_codon:yes gene_type:complete
MIELKTGKLEISIPIGMTTCPRDEPYIQESINSLIDNGWGVPLVYKDWQMRGDWWGFVKVLQLLVNAYPGNHYYVIVQDDAVAIKRPEEVFLSDWIEELPRSAISLYTSSPEIERWKKPVDYKGVYSVRTFTAKERANACNGGIAYVIPDFLVNIILEKAYTKWTPIPQMLGEICNCYATPYLITKENYFEHIGESSSLQPPDYKWDVTKAEPYRKRAEQ